MPAQLVHGRFPPAERLRGRGKASSAAEHVQQAVLILGEEEAAVHFGRIEKRSGGGSHPIAIEGAGGRRGRFVDFWGAPPGPAPKCGSRPRKNATVPVG